MLTSIKELDKDCLSEVLSFLDITDNETKHSAAALLNVLEFRGEVTISQIKNYWNRNSNYSITEDKYEKKWYKNGKLHRDNDLPAIIRARGGQVWYNHGNIHCKDDLPAIIDADGDQYWYKNGKLHREDDKPSVIHSNGDQQWYKHGNLHRDDDQPAIVCADGEKHWYKNGERYRDHDFRL